jgi:hypothetical protein
LANHDLTSDVAIKGMPGADAAVGCLIQLLCDVSHVVLQAPHCLSIPTSPVAGAGMQQQQQWAPMGGLQ